MIFLYLDHYKKIFCTNINKENRKVVMKLILSVACTNKRLYICFS